MSFYVDLRHSVGEDFKKPIPMLGVYILIAVVTISLSQYELIVHTTMLKGKYGDVAI